MRRENAKFTRITTISSLQLLKEINIRTEAVIHSSMHTFLCSYLGCKHLLTLAFCNNHSASWDLCQEESNVRGRNFSPLNSGGYLDLFFICFLSTPHCLLQAARAVWPALVGCPCPMDTRVLGLSLYDDHGFSWLQGRWYHTTWAHPREVRVTHTQAVRVSSATWTRTRPPHRPQSCGPRALWGQGLYWWKTGSFSFSFLLRGYKGQREDCRCMAVPQIKTSL